MHVPTQPVHLSPDLERRLERAFRGSSSYRSLASESRRAMARDLGRVLAYLTRPLPGSEHAPRYGAVGDTTAKVGEQFGNIVRQVDFPKFVSSLVDSIFKTIINSSIQQMKAYQEMVESIAKSAEQYAQDEVSDDEASTYLKQRMPSAFNPSSPGLQLADGLDADNMPDFKSLLGNMAPASISSDSSAEKAQLLLAAKVELARGRQQMLATTVLMGINRIIVTDGSINAKVVFDVSAKDTSSGMSAHASTGSSQSTDTDEFTAKGQASLSRSSHYNNQTNYNDRNWNHHYSHGASSNYNENYTFDRNTEQVVTRVSTHANQDMNKSASEIQAKAQLTGEVRINFRSETFPLERLADAGGLELLQDKSKPRPITPPAATTNPSTASPATTTTPASAKAPA